MAGELFTLPMRFGVRAAQLALRTGVHASERAFSLAWSAVGVVRGRDSQTEEEYDEQHAERGQNGATPDDSPEPGEATAREDTRDEATADEDVREEVADPRSLAEPVESTPAEPPDVEVASEPAAPVAATEPQPAHVTEEAVLVEAFAEPGAEDGAGAQVRIDEPWEGYTRMSADDVIARVEAATPEALAAVELYETVNQSRVTVLQAVERELQRKSGNRPAAADQTDKEQANGR